jgi:hypothetical protein
VEARVREFDPIAPRQRFERLRQIVLVRHGRAVHQRRDHGQFARQRRRDLEPNRVARIVQPPPVRVGDEPLPADRAILPRSSRFRGRSLPETTPADLSMSAPPNAPPPGMPAESAPVGNKNA